MDNLKTNLNDELVASYDKGVLTLRINRVKKLNAISSASMKKIYDLLELAKQDDRVKVVYFTSTGDFFSSGNDFNNFALLERDEMIADFEKFVKYIIDYPKVLISGVNGVCIGYAFTMLLSFDINLCADTAFFQTPFIQTGQTPEGLSSMLFALYLGKSTAGHLLLNGGPMTSTEAKECGFVTKVFEKEFFENDAYDYVLGVAKHPLKSLMNIKRIMNRNFKEYFYKLNKEECKDLRESWNHPEFQTVIKKFVKNPKF
jgi:enoyl-CoA hydratase/carnithine racemase